MIPNAHTLLLIPIVTLLAKGAMPSPAPAQSADPDASVAVESVETPAEEPTGFQIGKLQMARLQTGQLQPSSGLQTSGALIPTYGGSEARPGSESRGHHSRHGSAYY